LLSPLLIRMSSDTPMPDASKKFRKQSLLSPINKRPKSPIVQGLNPSSLSKAVEENTVMDDDTPMQDTDKGHSLSSTTPVSSELNTPDPESLSVGGQGINEPPVSTMQVSILPVITPAPTNNGTPVKEPTSTVRQGILKSSPQSSIQVKYTRFQVVMDLSKSTDSLYSVYARSKLLRVMSDIKSFDNRAQLIAWTYADRDTHFPISDFSSSSPLPSLLTDFTKYVYAFRSPRPEQRKESWTRICICHSCPVDHLLSNIQEVLQADGWRMNICRLQVEQSKTVGWLLYSCRHFQDDKNLSIIFSALFKHDISIYWRKLSGFSSNNTFQHALHVNPVIIERLYPSSPNYTDHTLLQRPGHLVLKCILFPSY